MSFHKKEKSKRAATAMILHFCISIGTKIFNDISKMANGLVGFALKTALYE